MHLCGSQLWILLVLRVRYCWISMVHSEDLVDPNGWSLRILFIDSGGYNRGIQVDPIGGSWWILVVDLDDSM